MFVRDSIHVGRPFEVVAPRFVSDTSWLTPIAAASVGVSRIEVGPVRARSRSILVPMWLIGRDPDRALPDLSGDLEVAPDGTAGSMIALGATYRRTTGERAEIRRVEQATEAGVRSFLVGIAGYFGDAPPAF